MARYFLILSLVVVLCVDRACAATHFRAKLNAAQVLNNLSNSTATGIALFELNNAETHLSYTLDLEGVDLEPIVANRTDPNDVVGIHIHLHVPDLIGPHILNIFGFPSEDDGDLVVDFENDSLSGVYDMSDSLDPITGEPFFPDDPLATKLIDDWLDELRSEQLYIAVHTVEQTANAPPGVAIRGNILQIPEPTSISLLFGLLAITTARRFC